MKTRIWIAMAALTLGALPVAASAATVEGTVITNVVSATFSTTFVPGLGSGYSVSYAATARVLTQDPCLIINKFAEPEVGQVSGEVVTFRIWVYNCSNSASAFNINVYDQLPLNTTYLGLSSAEPSPDWATGNSVTGVDGPYTWADMDSPTYATGQEYFRFRLSRLGFNKSAWVAYEVTIQ